MQGVQGQAGGSSDGETIAALRIVVALHVATALPKELVHGGFDGGSEHAIRLVVVRKLQPVVDAELPCLRPELQISGIGRFRNQGLRQIQAAPECLDDPFLIRSVEVFLPGVEQSEPGAVEVDPEVALMAGQKNSRASRHVRVVGEVDPLRRMLFILPPVAEDHQERIQSEAGRSLGKHFYMDALKVGTHLGKAYRIPVSVIIELAATESVLIK